MCAQRPDGCLDRRAGFELVPGVAPLGWPSAPVKSAREEAVWTAADYAVQISGLEVDTEVDDPDNFLGKPGLRTRLYADLDKLGFPRRQIDHVAIGVVCAKEIELMNE